jgi:Glycosyltransferase Family 4
MGTDSDYPRTLIVGVYFCEQGGAGTFLGALFSGWPVDRLATVCDGPLSPDWRRCRRHYRMGDLESCLRAPLKWLVPAKGSGPVLPSATAAAPAITTSSKASLGRRLAQTPWCALHRLLGCKDLFYRVGPSPELLAWVREFQPEVLYGHCSTLNSVRFLRRMQQALGLPLVLHLMDDFAEGHNREGWANGFLRRRYLAEFAELVSSADVAIAICQEMAEEYEHRYQRPVLWLPMPVELEAYQSAARTQWTAGRPFRLRYGGRVGWAIRQSLADLAGVVHALRQEGANVAFDLVTSQTEEVPPRLRCLGRGGRAIARTAGRLAPPPG